MVEFQVTREQLLEAGIEPLAEDVMGELLLSSSTIPTDMLLATGSIDLRPGDPTPASKTMPGVNWSPKVNWVEKLGGLPPYIRRIAKQLLYRQGMTRERAIATAINTVKKWCAAGSNESGINVKPDIRAQACAAVAAWEKMKAGARVVLSTPEDTQLDAIMTDREAFSLFGLQWPEDLPEYWDNPQGSDEYMSKLDALFPEATEQEEDSGQSTQEGDLERDSESAEQRESGVGEREPGSHEERSGEWGDAGEQEQREDAEVREHGGGQAEQPIVGSGLGQKPVQGDSLQAAEEESAGRDASEAKEGKGSLELASGSFSNAPWSNFKQSDYTDEQWRQACLIEIKGDSTYAKESCKLPVREPNGKLNWNGITAAASRLNQTQAPEELKRAAAKKIASFYRTAGKTPPTNVRQLAGMNLATETDIAVRAPWDISNVDKVTNRMYWKQIVPKGRMIYQGHVFDWNDRQMDLAIANFKAKAFDAVPFVLVNKDDGSHPVQDIEATRGVMLDLQRRSDGLYGLFQVDDRAEMVLSSSEGQLGVSPKVLFNYYREWDDRTFEGPTIEHVAATFHPRRNGQKPWQVAELSTPTAVENVVDLSGGEYTSLDAEREDGDPQVTEQTGQSGQGVSGTVATDTTNNDSQQEQTQQTQEQRPQVIQLANGETAELPQGMMLLSTDELERRERLLREQIERTDERATRVDTRVRTAEVETEIQKYNQRGVPFAMLELARPFLMKDEDNVVELEYMELSVTTGEDGKPKTDVVKKKDHEGDLIRKMLDMYVGTMELSGNGGPSERGSEVVSNGTGEEEEDADTAQRRHDEQMAAYRRKIGAEVNS